MQKLISLTVCSLLLTIIISTSSCKKTDTTPTQTVTYTLADYQGCISNYGIQYTDTLIDTITAAGIQQAFITAGVTYNPSKVTTTTLSALTVNALYNGNFDFISSIQVYINTAGAAGLGTKIAFATNIPANSTSVALGVNGNELKGYLGSNNVVTILVTNTGMSNGTCLDFTQGSMVSKVQQ